MTGKQIAERVGVWKRRLRLQDWEITIHVYDTAQIESDGTWAGIHRRTDAQTAQLHIAAQREPDDIDRTICHELLHLVLAPMWAAREIAVDQLGAQGAEMARRAISDGEEIAVYRLADAMCEAYGD